MRRAPRVPLKRLVGFTALAWRYAFDELAARVGWSDKVGIGLVVRRDVDLK